MLETDFRKSLLDVLCYFHQFCNEHQLRYYLIGGGLIGAVRHQGFIPWDDDVDVAMPREDYSRFLSLRAAIDADFDVRIPFVDPQYFNTMTRIFSKEYRIKQNYLNDAIIGPWIDIFPLDYTFDNSKLRFLHFRATYLFKVLSACKLGGVVVHGSRKARAKLYVHYLLTPVPQRLLSGVFEWLLTLKKKPGRYCGNLMGRWREKEIIEISELDFIDTYEFSGIKLASFKNYDCWLSHVYGDYMTLPGEADRTPDHSVVKVDE